MCCTYLQDLLTISSTILFKVILKATFGILLNHEHINTYFIPFLVDITNKISDDFRFIRGRRMLSAVQTILRESCLFFKMRN